MTLPVHIRPATPADLYQLPSLEVAGGEIFRTVAMGAIADDEPPSIESLQEFQSAGHAWVATAEPPSKPASDAASDDATSCSDRIVGYILVHLLTNQVPPSAAHIQQVTVSPSFPHQRIGARLVEHVEQWARDQGLRELTLTTFRDVPWNAPYYARLGFEVVGDEELGMTENAGLRELVEKEKGVEVLRRWERVAMRKGLRG